MFFAILAAALAVACVFFGIYWGMNAALLSAAGALLLFVLSMFFKYLQEGKEADKEKDGDEGPSDKKQ